MVLNVHRNHKAYWFKTTALGRPHGPSLISLIVSVGTKNTMFTYFFRPLSVCCTDHKLYDHRRPAVFLCVWSFFKFVVLCIFLLFSLLDT